MSTMYSKKIYDDSDPFLFEDLFDISNFFCNRSKSERKSKQNAKSERKSKQNAVTGTTKCFTDLFKTEE